MKQPSKEQEPPSMDKKLPIFLFGLFFAAVIIAFFVFAPSWGLMDDYQNVKMAREIWTSADHWQSLSENFMGAGMFRPVYFSWIAIFYFIFQNFPTGFYVFNALCNMAGMCFWGLAIYHLFGVRRQDYYWTVFFYPLTFFIFTAFWNIFNYISLQEKLIVLFAPLAIYFFQKSYREKLRWQTMVAAFVFLALGLYSKATFIFVPMIFLAYAVLDLVIFHYRPKTSWIMLAINSVIFGAYAVFTFTVQLHQSYTEKYRTNLSLTTFLDRIIHLQLVMKAMLIISVIGALAVMMYALRNKKPAFSLSILIYLGLGAYVLLLLPWGSQSYLLSATGPLVMAALFPVYDWFNRRQGTMKIALNAVIAVALVFIFAGNIVPNISRMADIGKAIAFLRDYRTPTSAVDLYFMPPPFSESAMATGQFSGKTVIFCADGKITDVMLSSAGKNYLMVSDYFSSIMLKDVGRGQQIYSNGSWRVYGLEAAPGHEENFTEPFPVNFVQALKIKIRNLY